MVEVHTFVKGARNSPLFIGFWVMRLTLTLNNVNILNVSTKKSNTIIVVPKVTTEAQTERKLVIAYIDLVLLVTITVFLVWTGVRIIDEIGPDWFYNTIGCIGAIAIGSALIYRKKIKSTITAYELVDIKFSPRESVDRKSTTAISDQILPRSR